MSLMTARKTDKQPVKQGVRERELSGRCGGVGGEVTRNAALTDSVQGEIVST